jgi:hypothetical protein
MEELSSQESFYYQNKPSKLVPLARSDSFNRSAKEGYEEVGWVIIQINLYERCGKQGCRCFIQDWLPFSEQCYF